jgi:hypothetical protein
MNLKEFSLLDLLSQFRGCTDRFQFLSRSFCDCLGLHGVPADTVRQQFPFQTLSELAARWRALVIHETAPTNIAFDDEVVLRTPKERAAIVTRLRSQRVIMRRAAHH